MRRGLAAVLGLLMTVAVSVVATPRIAHAASPGMPLPGGAPEQLLIDAVHHHVFVSSGHASDAIIVADYTPQLVAQIPVPEVYGMVMTPDDRYIYAASWYGNWPDSHISKIDTSTLQVVQTWAAPSEYCPKWLALTSTRLWMSGMCSYDQSSGAIASVDLSLGDFQLTSGAGPGRQGRLVLTPDQTRLAYVDDSTGGPGVFVYDVHGTSIGSISSYVGNIPLNAGGWDSDLSISDDGTQLLTQGSHDGTKYGASLLTMPNDDPPGVLYPAGSPTAATWSADRQWVVVADTVMNTDPGHIDYYRTSDPSHPVAQVVPYTSVSGGAIAITPDDALVFTAENPDYGWDDSSLHVYPGPGAVASTTPPPPADTTPPTASLHPLPAVLLRTAYDVTWTASDAGSGVASVDVRYRQAGSNGSFGAWAMPWQSVTSSFVRLPVRAGYEYCVEVRAHDRAGNVSAWSAMRCTSVPLDDRALRLGPVWNRRTASGYYYSTYTATARSGSTLTAAGVSVRRIALIVSIGPNCGRLAVYVGNRYVGQVSLAANRTHNEQIAFLPATSLLSGTLTIRSMTGAIVRVDGVALLH